MKLFKKHKKLFLIFAFSLLLLLVVLFYFSFTKETEKIDDLNTEIKSYEESTIIPPKFLSEDELIDLGLDPKTKAQIIKDEPLIYKVIKSDDEIITDVAPYLQVIREDNRK